MSAVSTRAQAEVPKRRGRGGRRNFSRRNDGTRGPQPAQANEPIPAAPQPTEVQPRVEAPPETSTSSDVDVCFICAETVKFYCLSECNHRTCHICALRLRALYKKTECTFCKHPQNIVIFTESPDSRFVDHDIDTATFRDTKLDIVFETQEIMEETMVLLRFNCPDDSCLFVAKGWNDLKVHVRAVHSKLMCDLCIRHKKVFAHEHTLYTASQLAVHLPSLRNNRHGKAKEKEKSRVDNFAHPFCEFCRECFFGDDEMFKHMREAHEECFLCKRQDIRFQYFENYDSLERHFYDAHYPCAKPECQAEKFVVFGSEMDFKAHMLERHGSEMSAKDIKDARKVQMHFGSIAVDRGGGGGRGRGRGSGPSRDAPPHITESRPGPSRGGGRRAGFGAALTSENAPPTEAQFPALAQNGRSSPVANTPSDVDPETLRRHADFMRKVVTASTNQSAATVVRSAIRAFKNSESGARDLISTFYSIVDRDLEKTASLIVPLVDLLDEEEKRLELLRAFHGFKIEQRDEYPDLIAGGQQSAFSGVASGRVINAKHSTASRQSTGQIWDRVARAASSSPALGQAGPSQAPANRFPALPSTSQTVKSQLAPKVPGFRQPQRSTPWAASSASPSPGQTSTASRAKTNMSKNTPAPSFTRSSFPSLPQTAPRDPKPIVRGNTSLRNILGNTAPTTNRWLGAEDGADNASGADDVEGPDDPSNQSRNKKKEKGKQRVTLFTLNSLAA